MSTSTAVEDRRAFVEAVRAFVERECGTREQRAALTSNGSEAHNQEINRKLAGLGWSGVALETAWGGAGAGVTEACVLLEELAHGQVPVFGLGISMIVARTVQEFGTDAQREDVVGGFCRGEVFSVAMSEPDSGSDVASLSCRAERVEGGYRINGQKTWISCAHYARTILLVCRTGSTSDKHEGITMLLVPTDTPGLMIRPIDTLGGREVNDLYFTDAFVPDDALVGLEGAAWRQLMAGLNFERVLCAATFLGNARAAFDDAVDYVRTREQFGRPIGSFQAIKHRIADLATELECCALLVHDVARKIDEEPDGPYSREASMAKLKVTETAKRISIEGMQMMGGAGYSTEYDMEQHLRRNIISTVFAGTSEMQREIIAKAYRL
ncbi:acyl-CoA dehydrogenase family protein [Pseudonocardia sp. NPDC046786]|uniref:acyl-CoA dehydrogenase family protein n=1 Tax=Pseudonocardia sp. NPDC046786 TaxID=3155471 RepID=UPI0034077177